MNKTQAVSPVSPITQKQQPYPPLELITSPTVSTNAAAFYTNRKPQTLRAWACFENGALRPIRILGRLAWPVAEIRLLMTGGAI